MSRLVALVVALTFAGCADEGDAERDDVDSTTTMTAFVIDVIENQTADDAVPLEMDVFEHLLDPDTHDDDDDVYSRLFVE